ncbi:MAG: hypothetical protein LBE35_03910 [Clostridiales bacterium]|jgi:hypothetical protein|nr:hypothetical protein [Clostridiales bacterium]
MNNILGIAKINARQSKLAYWIVGAIALSLIVQGFLALIGVPTGSMAAGNSLYLLPLLIAIFIPALNFTKIMNLGGKRADFFKACILNYAVVALLVTAAALGLYYTFDAAVQYHTYDALNLFDVFGFIQNGPIIAFIQMFAFLLLLSAFTHTLTLSQTRWYGIAASIAIVAIISVFTPIAPLRAALVWFFNMIIFHNSAAVQIASCLVLATIIYALSLFPIKSKGA